MPRHTYKVASVCHNTSKLASVQIPGRPLIIHFYMFFFLCECWVLRCPYYKERDDIISGISGPGGGGGLPYVALAGKWGPIGYGFQGFLSYSQ